MTLLNVLTTFYKFLDFDMINMFTLFGLNLFLFRNITLLIYFFFLFLYLYFINLSQKLDAISNLSMEVKADLTNLEAKLEHLETLHSTSKVYHTIP